MKLAENVSNVQNFIVSEVFMLEINEKACIFSNLD